MPVCRCGRAAEQAAAKHCARAPAFSAAVSLCSSPGSHSSLSHTSSRSGACTKEKQRLLSVPANLLQQFYADTQASYHALRMQATPNCSTTDYRKPTKALTPLGSPVTTGEACATHVATPDTAARLQRACSSA